MLWHIIVAAGSGSRFGADIPKQYCLFEGRPMVMMTIDRLRRFDPDANVLLVISPLMLDYWNELCHHYSFASPKIAFGGATRAESVRNALAEIPAEASRISVHDAARPLISNGLIDRLLKALDESVDGVIPATPMTDSLRRKCADGDSVPVNRADFVAVQTPQIFHADRLRKAYALPLSETLTDDASVMQAAGFDRIRLVDGDTHNIKITNAVDIDIAKAILRHSAL